METLEQIRETVTENALVASLAPKISIENFASKLATKNIAWMIPNATSFISLGFNPICFVNGIDKSLQTFILELLKILGNTIETEEKKLEAYAIASAMLPTYFWFQWHEMKHIAKEMGLTQKESHDAIYETLKASLELIYNRNLSYEEVTDLIPVKPIEENEAEIKDILNTKLLGLFNTIKPLSK